MNKFILFLIIGLLFAVNISAQSRYKKPIRKTALATYITSASSKNGGIIELKLNGKVIEFNWSAIDKYITDYLPPFGDGKGYEKGAEWSIFYSYLTSENDTGTTTSYYFLWSARFTGRNLLKATSQKVIKPISAPHIPLAYRQVLQKWLADKEGWRPATLNDALSGREPDIRRFLLGEIKSAGKNYHPYYVTDDFNKDRKQDFAIIIISNDRKKYAIAIFNAPFGNSPTFYTEEIGKNYWLFWKKDDKFGRRFIVGPPASDSGYLIKPRGNTYYTQ